MGAGSNARPPWSQTLNKMKIELNKSDKKITIDRSNAHIALEVVPRKGGYAIKMSANGDTQRHYEMLACFFNSAWGEILKKSKELGDKK